MNVEKDPLDIFNEFVESCNDIEKLGVCSDLVCEILELQALKRKADKMDEDLYLNPDRAQFAIYVMNLDEERIRFAADKISGKVSYLETLRLRQMEREHSESGVESSSEDQNDSLTEEEKNEEGFSADLPTVESSMENILSQIIQMQEFLWKDGMLVSKSGEKESYRITNVIGLKPVCGGFEIPEGFLPNLDDAATKGIFLAEVRKLVNKPTLFVSPPNALSEGWSYAYISNNGRLSYPKHSYKVSEAEVLALLFLNYKNYL
jgi:hypothetical protein